MQYDQLLAFKYTLCGIIAVAFAALAVTCARFHFLYQHLKHQKTLPHRATAPAPTPSAQLTVPILKDFASGEVVGWATVEPHSHSLKMSFTRLQNVDADVLRAILSTPSFEVMAGTETDFQVVRVRSFALPDTYTTKVKIV